MWWSILTSLVILFEIWYVAAYLVAYSQTHDRMLLWQVAHALLLLIAFAYMFYALGSNLGLNLIVMLGLLIASMVCSLAWRRDRSTLARFLKLYPRGTSDVLLFRKPVVDLKRRVRTK